VLLVDDDVTVRRAARIILERQGYQVIEAQNDHAVEICRSHVGQIDLLLTDVMMPGINGVELARRVKALRPTILVLYMSGYADSVEMGQELLNDEQSFIQKPFTAQALLSKIRMMLDAVL
jgi:CheY-like chemotaxis protein